MKFMMMVKGDKNYESGMPLIGGYAIERAKDFMKLHVGVLGSTYEGECEVRQIFDPRDCGPGRQ